MANLINFYLKINNTISKLANKSYDLIALGLRYWVFSVFFWSGWLKLSSWQPTIFLFTYEFNVTWLPLPPPLVEYLGVTIPSFSPTLAAYSGTAAEILLPLFIIIGFGARIPAIMLFIFNYVAVASYPFLWTDVGLAGFKDHIIWGLVIAFIMLRGPGKISLDHLLHKFKCQNYRY